MTDPWFEPGAKHDSIFIEAIVALMENRVDPERVLSPEERARQASQAWREEHRHYGHRSEEAALAYTSRRLDPNGVLSPRERSRRAEAAWTAEKAEKDQRRERFLEAYDAWLKTASPGDGFVYRENE